MRTKQLLPLILLGIAGVLTGGCGKTGFLDQTVTSNLNETTTFTDSANAMSFLNNIYAAAGFAQDPKRFSAGIYAGGLDASCDEAEGPNSSSSNGFIQFATGTVNSSVVPDDAWGIPYGNIRAVNQFLRNLYRIPIPAVLKTQTRAEARFLRAWYYAVMLQHYGGVPIIGDTVYTASDKINATRRSFRSCVDYILSECDAAANDLPIAWVGAQYGRASKGACLALKSRVLLFAASPLFNNGGTAQGTAGLDTIVAYPDSDPSRWQLAADAARALIVSNAYKLYYDSTTKAGEKGFGFQSLFVQRTNNPEYVFARMMGENKYLESFWDVPSRGGSGGPFPYQEMVDAFGMNNGLPITDPGSGYDPTHPYLNRDPRLDYSIIHDSSLRPVFGANQPAPVTLYLNGGGDAVYKGTPTGYYIYKMMDRDLINNSLGTTVRCLPLIRYAEILLNYAEATNEASGPTTEAIQAVEAIRQRAGLRPYQLPSGLTQDEFRTIIRNERQVELAYEGIRFFDVRRWMIGEQTQDKMMHGMEVDRNGGSVTYKTFDVRKHNFNKAMYLWPIPLKEIAKSPELQQNPLY